MVQGLLGEAGRPVLRGGRCCGGVLAAAIAGARLSVGVLVTLALLHQRPATTLLAHGVCPREGKRPSLQLPGRGWHSCARAGCPGAVSQVSGAAAEQRCPGCPLFPRGIAGGRRVLAAAGPLQKRLGQGAGASRLLSGPRGCCVGAGR